ncbi:MAG: hypothetical protein JRI72_03020, partial [Deltaproteobacteria bacterium]|nr:hypothetical protein [Deltaproteobacteria bacterium]
MEKENLALCGGKPVRYKPFMSRPCIGKEERQVIEDCLNNKMVSRFIGSPVGNFRKILSLPSKEAVQIEEFWSILGGPYVRKFEYE